MGGRGAEGKGGRGKVAVPLMLAVAQRTHCISARCHNASMRVSMFFFLNNIFSPSL